MDLYGCTVHHEVSEKFRKYFLWFGGTNPLNIYIDTQIDVFTSWWRSIFFLTDHQILDSLFCVIIALLSYFDVIFQQLCMKIHPSILGERQGTTVNHRANTYSCSKRTVEINQIKSSISTIKLNLFFKRHNPYSRYHSAFYNYQDILQCKHWAIPGWQLIVLGLKLTISTNLCWICTCNNFLFLARDDSRLEKLSDYEIAQPHTFASRKQTHSMESRGSDHLSYALLDLSNKNKCITVYNKALQRARRTLL